LKQPVAALKQPVAALKQPAAVAAGLNVCGKTYYIYAKGKKIPLCGLCMPELY
jgi:hypothetical protein